MPEESAMDAGVASFAPAQPVAAAPAARRVLVADDNDDITLTLSIMLEMMGFEVLRASNGRDALALAKRERPDLLFLDIGMPGLDGWEVCRQVRLLRGDAPVIVAITGYGQEDDRAQSLQAGFDAHLTKPMRHDMLVRLIERLSKKLQAPQSSPRSAAPVAPIAGTPCFWSDTDASALSEMLLDRSPFHGVIFIDAEEKIRGWNRGACHITGFTAADVIGQPAHMLFTAEDRARGLADLELRIAREAGVAEDERWHLRKGGSVFWSGGHTMAFRGPSGELTGYVKAFRDATHLRTRMKSLENDVVALRAHGDRVDVWVGEIAHELRNPLSPLKSVLGILQREQASSGVDPAVLQVMARQLDAMERRVEDLIDLTRIKSGKLRIALRRVPMQPLIQETVASFASAATAKDIQVRTLLPEVPLEAVVDADRIQQVLANLLGNAIKFTPAGRSIWVTLTADHTHFLLQVKDEGQGISASLMPQIFDAFTQATESDTGRGKGVGLGLTVVKQIATLHQGTIEVRSEGEGKGSDFTVRIPLVPPDGETPAPFPARE